ncbi:MAG TPA: ABC transporter permease [Dehalococcoidia bacterium]|nr:ABC transporter permease [Dehalococcoidia bacterium]
MTGTTAALGGGTTRLAELTHAWELLYLLTRRDLKLRYQDTVLGFFWTAAKPLLFGLVVWFALHKALRVQTPIPFHLFLLSALLPWTLFQVSLLFATPLFANNGSLVKKVPFPAYVLPLATIANNTVHFLLSLPVLVIFLLLDGRTPGPEWVVGIPLLLGVELTLTTGLALMFSALDVQFRDLEHLVDVLLGLLFYATPILYPLSAAPHPYDDILKLNPLSTLLEAWRDLLVKNELPGAEILPAVVLTAAIAALGTWVFSRLRPTFADYL